MLYNTKLNEFEPEQLDLFLNMANDKIESIRNEFDIISSWEGSEIKYNKEKVLEWEFDSVTLLKVQLENAKKDIQQMRQPTEN